MQLFISHLASWLRTRRFSEPTFRPSGATNHWKNTVFRDFPTFSRICIFFLLIFSLLTLLTSAFQLSILSEVSLLNFLRSLQYILHTNCHNHTQANDLNVGAKDHKVTEGQKDGLGVVMGKTHPGSQGSQQPKRRQIHLKPLQRICVVHWASCSFRPWK